MKPSVQKNKTTGKSRLSYQAKRGSSTEKTVGLEASNRLQHGRRLLDRIMETSPAGITVLDKDGKIIFANAEAEKILSLVRDKIKQRSYNAPDWHITSFDGGPFPDEELPFRRVMSTGQPVFNIRHAIEWPGGHRRLLSINASPLTDSEDLSVGMVAVIEDITERVKATEALSASEQKYRLMVETLQEGIWTIDKEGFTTYVNPRMASMLGYMEQEMAGRNLLEFMDEKGREMARANMDRRAAGIKEQHDFEFLKKDGGRIYARLETGPLYDEKRNYVGAIAGVMDVSELHKANEGLKLSEEKFSRFFQCNPSIAAITEMTTGELVDVNQAFIDVIGFSLEELVGHTTGQLNIWVDLKARDGMIEVINEGGKFRNIETLIRTKNGEILTLLFSGEKFTVGNRDLLFTQAIDITPQIKAVKELKNSREQLRNFAASLQTAREQERKEIAIDIHDDLGQALTALQIDLAWMSKRIDPEHKRLVEKVGAMLKLIKETDKKVKHISSTLRPPLLDDLGLAITLQAYVREFGQRTGIKCGLRLEPEEIAMDEERSIAVFRIVQEALTNIIRHAAASRARIVIQVREGEILVEISDNGMGIEAKDVTSNKSLGIIGMRERAATLGGTIEIIKKRGGGTALTARIPFSGDR
jgi:two-component system sensor histidine kinase UhpB